MLSRRICNFRPEMGRVILSAAANGSNPANVFGNHKASIQAFSTKKEYARLPKLPVPETSATLGHFLEFAKAIQTKTEFAKTQTAVKQAEKEVSQLQQLLVDRAAKYNNWLTPWWLNVAYLAARSPLPVVTSPGVMFPHFEYKGIDGQIDYSAKITQLALKFYHSVKSNELKQDMAGGVPFDMSQYKFLYGTTRVPKKGADEIVYGCSNQNEAKHIIALRNGHIFSVPVLDASGRPFSLAQLRAQFSRVVRESEQRLEHQLGIVSSDNRDRWAETYESLKQNPRNASHIALIEDSLFAVCLDEDSKPALNYTEKDEQAAQSLHGGGYKSNSGNRWFDKTIQFVMGQNGYCGMNYEHTPCEGPPVAALMDYVCDQIKANNYTEGESVSEPTVKRLDFELNDDHKTRIAKSAKKMNKVVAETEVISYTFDVYGKNFPKLANISPDSYIQMAFQLAFYRIHRTCPPTYETATLRKFDEGRTQNIRSPTTLATEFVTLASKGRSTMPDLYQALKAAAQAHKNYSQECMNGGGMDRHLLAWKLLANENGIPLPKILESPAYEQMNHFQVSTSQVPTRNFIQMCFGPSAPDCYGVCYNPQETELHFTICTFRGIGGNSAKKFACELHGALKDMQSICKKGANLQAKL